MSEELDVKTATTAALNDALPTEKTLDLLGADFGEGSGTLSRDVTLRTDPPEPGALEPQGSRYREFPEKFRSPAQPQPQPKEGQPEGEQPDNEYSIAIERIVEREVLQARAEKVAADITNAFVEKHKADFVCNPLNDAIIRDAMIEAGLSFTPENLAATFQACKFMLDNKPANQFSQADFERLNQVPWPVPPIEFIQKAQPQPRPAPARSRPEVVSTGLPDRQSPLTVPEDNSGLAERLPSMPIDQARQRMTQLMLKRARELGDRNVAHNYEMTELRRRYRTSWF